MAKDRDVEDRDLGYKALTARLVAADGMQGRAGYLSGRPKYPKGGTAVAKVAGVHGMLKAMQQIVHGMSGQLKEAMDAAAAAIMDGTPPEQALLVPAQMIRDAMRDHVEDNFQRHTGLLKAHAKAAVFERGKWRSGDKPGAGGAK